VITLVPDHSSICDKSYLTEMIDSIQAWIDTAADAIKQGMSLKEAQSKISLLERYPLSATLKARSMQIQRRNIARIYQILNVKN